MKTVLATGVVNLNNKIEKKFANELEVVSKPLYSEAIITSVARNEANLVIISDVIEGGLDLNDIILTLRARHPKTRIVIIVKNMSKELKSFLYKYNVFDILNESFTEEEIRTAIFKPKTWEDVAGEFETLKNYSIDEELLKVDVEGMNQINKNEYKRLRTPSTGKDTVYQEIIPFWSSIDQSGKSFLSLNTALVLASNPDLKVLLIDFNVHNPSIHLQLGFTDGDKNLGAFIEDCENEEFEMDEKLFLEYLIVHPVYKNLSILPGYILNMKEKTSEEFIQYFDAIIRFASFNNYSTILIDMSAGIHSDLNKHILREATKVIFVLNESPNSLYSSKKLFDPEIGDYTPTLIGKKKLFPVVNSSLEDYRKKFKVALEVILDGNHVVATIPKTELIHKTIFEGSPLMKEPTEEMYQVFFPIIDLIHPNFFKKLPKKEAPAPVKETKKGFGLFNKSK